ncbi:hypothetical protein DOY81_008149 [Sarcophaga bullata]|nr:hypothetical protein DOY81_008149 [Sarcophaga bullata]
MCNTSFQKNGKMEEATAVPDLPGSDEAAESFTLENKINIKYIFIDYTSLRSETEPWANSLSSGSGTLSF